MPYLIRWWSNNGYSAEYQTVLNAAGATSPVTGTPTAAQKIAQDAFLVTLKNAGILDITDTLKVICGNGPANFTDLDWKNPSIQKTVRTSGPKFYANNGVLNDGSATYLDMAWAPSTGPNYTQNNAEIVIAYKNIVTSITIPDGVRNTTDVALNPGYASGQVLARSNSGTGTTPISDAQFDSSDGIYFLGRTAAGSEFAKKNNGSRVTASNASTARPGLNFYLGCFNLNGTPSLFNSRTIQLFWAGGLLTTQQETTFYNAWTTYQAAVAASAYTTIGTIYNKSSWTDLSDFTNNGSTSSIVSNAIQFSGGTGAYTQSLGLTNQTKLPKWTITARFKVGSNGATDYGFGVGIRSSNSYGLVDVVGRFLMWNGANPGRLIINADASHTAVASSASNVSFSVNDIIELVLDLKDDVITLSGRNVTTSGATLSCSYTYTGSSPYMPNTGYFSIYSLGGTFTCTQYTITSNEIYQADLMFIGDSKTQRYQASKWPYTYVNKFMEFYGNSVVNYGGGYNRTQDVLNSMYEITNIIKPKKAVLVIGSNDVRSGVADATMKSNYASIVSQLIAAGIDVVHTTGIYETSISQSSLQAYINSNYSASKIIDSVNTVVALGGDGIHPTDNGMVTFANLLLNSGKI